MKKIIALVIATAALLAGSVSCDPVESDDSNTMVTYLIQGLPLEHPDGELAEAASKAVNAGMREVTMDVNNIYVSKADYVLSQLDAIYEKYNNGWLKGTVTVMSSVKIDGTFTPRVYEFKYGTKNRN